MKAFVLTYHSHHVVGEDYARNDHVALEEDLITLSKCGFKVVPLDFLVRRIQSQTLGAEAVTCERLCALTFDDGPIFDVEGFVHPRFGRQPGFLNVMQEFLSGEWAFHQDSLHATSFVIACAHARRVMENNADPQYTYLNPGAMTDGWWNCAIDTGLIDIANHSWDHLHPALPVVAHSRQARADFSQVDNEADADAQILHAARAISATTRGRAKPFFAFPFGQYNSFLTDDYLPRRGPAIGVEAAFSTRPAGLARSDSIWCLPRLTCGHHWRTSKELALKLLDSVSSC